MGRVWRMVLGCILSKSIGGSPHCPSLCSFFATMSAGSSSFEETPGVG